MNSKGENSESRLGKGNRDWETCALGDWCGVDVVACAGCEAFAVVWR